ncbi:MAG: hypothetical protein H3C58_11000 [Fimbriimonadaceae bacterium]|nr:hypothetical protein [Fimbriimonadaceae bacterium]
MSLPELRKLAKVHALDASLREIRARLSQLDGGKRLQEQIEKIRTDHAATLEKTSRLTGEQRELESQNQATEAKIKKFEAELYSGKVVNPREIAAIEKEIAALKRQREAADERLLELMEEVPPAKAASKVVEDAIAAREAQLAEYRAKEGPAREKLEAEYKKRLEMRPTMLTQIDSSLVQKYETICKANHGIGLSIVEAGRCGCGVQIPARTMAAAQEGKVVVCQGCHRIIYAPEGVV